MITLNYCFEARTTELSTNAPFGAGDANYFEPFHIADYAVIHFTELMRTYTDTVEK